MGLLDILPWLDNKRRVAAQNIGEVVQNPVQTLGRYAQGTVEDLAQQAGGLLNASANMRSAIPELRQQAQEQMLSGLLSAGGPAAPIVYHGTPHKFDRFDLSKIGTGEGAQAYGHGMYFAENPQVAKQYALAANDTNPAARHYLSLWQGDAAKAEKAFLNDLATGAFGNMSKDDAANIVGAIKGRSVILKQDLPDEVLPRMLQWDKPLSEQPELFAKLKASGIINDKSPPHQKSGQAKPQALLQMPGETQSITKALSNAGIPGLSYLDAGSRAAGKGSMNYVIWDQALLDRMKPTPVTGLLGK